MPLNLVLSYGDLTRPGGYRTRVLGELQALDRQADADPFLVVFDRNPHLFEESAALGVPHQVLHRRAPLQFYRVLARLEKTGLIRVIHAHNLYSAALALSGRRKYGYKVVLDYHGRIPEEYIFLGKGGAVSHAVLEFLERWCVTRCDHIVVVSGKLKEYLIDAYELRPESISVIPCCADSTIFNWDVTRREAIRGKMNLTNKFVCVHLGSFFEWYDPEMITQIYGKIRDQIDSHLLVITGEVEKAKAYLGARMPADSFSVLHANHDEVPGLLNASDLGFLMLRPSPNIETSSPAKFAEYLNSGLPVLITPRVGDFSDLVAARHVGAVLQSPFESMPLLDRITRNRVEVADLCVSAGSELTWQAYVSTWMNIVTQPTLTTAL